MTSPGLWKLLVMALLTVLPLLALALMLLLTAGCGVRRRQAARLRRTHGVEAGALPRSVPPGDPEPSPARAPRRRTEDVVGTAAASQSRASGSVA